MRPMNFRRGAAGSRQRDDYGAPATVGPLAAELRAARPTLSQKRRLPLFGRATIAELLGEHVKGRSRSIHDLWRIARKRYAFVPPLPEFHERIRAAREAAPGEPVDMEDYLP